MNVFIALMTIAHSERVDIRARCIDRLWKVYEKCHDNNMLTGNSVDDMLLIIRVMIVMQDEPDSHLEMMLRKIENTLIAEQTEKLLASD